MNTYRSLKILTIRIAFWIPFDTYTQTLFTAHTANDYNQCINLINQQMDLILSKHCINNKIMLRSYLSIFKKLHSGFICKFRILMMVLYLILIHEVVSGIKYFLFMLFSNKLIRIFQWCEWFTLWIKSRSDGLFFLPRYSIASPSLSSFSSLLVLSSDLLVLLWLCSGSSFISSAEEIIGLFWS